MVIFFFMYVWERTDRVGDLFRDLLFNKQWQPFRDHLPFIWSTRLGPPVKLHNDQIIVLRQHSDRKKTQNQYFSVEDSYFRISGSNMQQPSIHPSILYTWLTTQCHIGLDSLMHLVRGAVVLDRTSVYYRTNTHKMCLISEAQPPPQQTSTFTDQFCSQTALRVQVKYIKA